MKNKTDFRAMGQRAFERGAQAVPALDKELMGALRGAFSVSDALTDWLAGWHAANLTAPIR